MLAKDKHKKFKISFFILLALTALFLLILVLVTNTGGIFHPKGIIAIQEKHLIITLVSIMLIAVIPLYLLVFAFVWKTKKNDQKDESNWDYKGKTELVWWVLPVLVVVVLATITWKSSHALDPFKSLASANQPITIQVVALRWKWLFIYPNENLASVNFVEFPVDTPVVFHLTADAPMNSFWIPQLGGQMYAMAGMQTKLNLQAKEIGEFTGSAAEINGDGFSGMKFKVVTTTKSNFDEWVKSNQNSNSELTFSEYNKLANPSENNTPTMYRGVDKNLFDLIIKKYVPSHSHN